MKKLEKSILWACQSPDLQAHYKQKTIIPWFRIHLENNLVTILNVYEYFLSR